ncbi:MAG: TonB-dependent receptor [Bacteroidota bacterium]|nr:TonB-dependent receptor [Bacteroidota bacterium]
MLTAVRTRLGYTDYEHDEIEDGAVASNFAVDNIEGRIELDHLLSDQTKGVLGVQASSGTLETSGEEAYIPRTSTARVGLFILERYDTGPVGFEAGARFEFASIEADTEGQTRNFSGLSLSTGVNLKQSERLSVSLSAARSVKIPDAAELFSNGVHIGTGAFEIGNPDLKAESALSVDLSVQLENGPMDLTTTLYSNRFRDFIYLRDTDEEREGFPVYQVSQGTARFLGFEAEADVELLHGDAQHLAAHLWTDYTRATLVQDDEPLPRIPPLRLGAGLSFDRGPLAAKLSYKRVRAQERIATHEEETEGYNMLDASLRYRLFLGQTVHNFTLQGSNLTDVLGRVHTSFQKELIPLAGRDIRLTYQMTF